MARNAGHDRRAASCGGPRWRPVRQRGGNEELGRVYLERSDIHVVDRWQFLGTARSESELYELLESRPPHFDKRLQVLLNRTLSRMPQRKIVDLSPFGRRCADDKLCASPRLE
jgi:hypothetical protein